MAADSLVSPPVSRSCGQDFVIAMAEKEGTPKETRLRPSGVPPSPHATKSRHKTNRTGCRARQIVAAICQSRLVSRLLVLGVELVDRPESSVDRHRLAIVLDVSILWRIGRPATTEGGSIMPIVIEDCTFGNQNLCSVAPAALSGAVGEIDKATLAVTPAAATRSANASNPSFTGAITGFVNGENASVISTLPV